jgi:hypothetical protein
MKRPTITIILLATCTLAGFVVVSSLVGGRRSQQVPVNNAEAQITPTAVPQVTVSPPSTVAKTNPSDAQLRADLSRAQTLLNQLNEAITMGDWHAAQEFFTQFEQCTRQYPTPQLNHPDISPVMQDFFSLYKVQFVRALSAQDSQQSRFAANQLFGIVSEQRARLGTRGVPIELQRLGFLIREIDIWKQANDAEMLQVRLTSLKDTWKEIRPMIIARRNGIEQAKVFDGMLEKLVALDISQDFVAIVSDLNKEFERLNNLFQRPTHPPTSPPGAGKRADDD